MKTNTKTFGINKSTIRIFNNIMLFAMLHSSVVAPSQVLINDYIGYYSKPKPLSYKGAELIKYDRPANRNQQDQNTVNNAGSTALYIPVTSGLNYGKASKEHIVFPADIQEGVIGVTKQQPLDDAADNLFKFTINESLPANSRVYLTYDLFGVQDVGAVSKSINDRLATGGHIIKYQMGWTSQKELINAEWLRLGENKILFTLPKGAQYQYRIKNLKVQVENEDELQSALVLNNPLTKYVKDNQLYIKGFSARGASGDLRIYVDDTEIYQNGGEFEAFFELTPTVKSKKIVMVRAFDAKGMLGQEPIFLDNLLEADASFPIEKGNESKASIFKANTSDSLSINGASLTVKENVLSDDKAISVTQLRTVDIAPMASGMINVTKGGLAYRFLPDGTTFEKPVEIAIEYDEKLIPSGYSPKDVRTFYFNTRSKSWVAVKRDTVNVKENKIISHTTHFTDYVNGIIQVPESPQTAAFTPTMMNDIKAADPAAEMTIISPPEVSQKGDANVSYPIKIPSGRKGLQPQLEITYSNEGENSWLGQGWNITTPAISIDTKWGVPILDPSIETEIYALEGQQLMYPKLNGFDWMPNRHYDTSTASTIYNTADRPRIDNAVFTPRKQGSFALIERLGNNVDSYYWKVTATNGTVNWYGGKDAVVENSVIRNARGSIVHWALYMTQDVYGNCTMYNYSNYYLTGQSGLNSNLNNGKVFNISSIYYNGYNGSDFKYEVRFNTASGVRLDPTINARLGVKQVDPYFLDNIIVKKIDSRDQIRKYTFKMGYGKFGKGQLRAVSELDSSDKVFYSHSFDYYNDLTPEGGGPDIYFNAGIDVSICNDGTAPCPDTDHDGVCNATDLCPEQPGPASNNGCPEACPDNDHDGVCNDVDDCINEPGPASNNGCPIQNLCYGVHFTAPNVVKQLRSYWWSKSSADTNGTTNPGDSSIIGTCSRAATRLDNIVLNGETFTNSMRSGTNLYYTHGNLAGLMNLCPSYIPYGATYANPDPIIQSPNAVNYIRDWFDYTGLTGMPHTNLAVQNFSGIYLEPYNWPGYTWSLSSNSRIQVTFLSFYNLSINVTRTSQLTPTNTVGFVNTSAFDNYPANPAQYAPIGLDTEVYIDGVQVLGGPFNFVDDFVSFQQAIYSQFSATISSIGNDGSGVLNYILQFYGTQPYSQINFVYNGQDHIQNFTVSPTCSTLPSRPANNVAQNENIPIEKISKLNQELAINKWVADGNELQSPIAEAAMEVRFENPINDGKSYVFYKKAADAYWMDEGFSKIMSNDKIALLNKVLPDNIDKRYQELQESNKDQVAKTRSENQQKAIKWLAEFSAERKKQLTNIFSKTTSNQQISGKVKNSAPKKDYGQYFRDMADAYTYTFHGTVPINSDPNCPWFLNYDLLFQDVIPSFDSTLAVLGTSVTKADNIGFYIGIGIGCKWYTKSTTFGAQWTWSKDSSKARIALVDINGDGLEDIVFNQYDGFLYYKAHQMTRTYDDNNQPVITHSFGPMSPMTGINNFYNAYGSAKSRNFQITFGVASVGGFLGKDKSSSKATNNVYFTDGNGDGLMDVVKNGVVYFNRLDSNNNPLFNAESEKTENMVIIAEPASVTEPTDPDDIVIPSYDVVKVWEAPAAGTIRIENTIVNTSPTEQSVITVEMQKDVNGAPKQSQAPVISQPENATEQPVAENSNNANTGNHAENEKTRKAKIEATEKSIKEFINQRISNYALSATRLAEVTNPVKDNEQGHDTKVTLTGADLERAINNAKRENLRKLYFQQNPNKLDDYNMTPPANATACDHGDFEDGLTNDYEIWIKPESGTAIECDFDTTTANGFYAYVPPSAFPPSNHWATVTDGGTNPSSPIMDPVLLSSGVSVPIAHNGRYSLRVNDNLAPGSDHFQASKMVKSFYLDYMSPSSPNNANSAVSFSFNFICMNPSDHDPKQQPRFIARLYDKNDNILDQFCLVSDVNNTLMFNNATPASTISPLLYTGWQCATLSTGSIQNQTSQADREVRLEISVNDCTPSAHFGYAYIDDICTNAVNQCDAAYGQLNLDFNNPQLTNCPSFPIFVTGTYTAPHSLNPPIVYPANTPTLTLEVLQGSTVISTVNLPVTALTNPAQQHTFSFQLNEANFGGLPINGNFEFRVTAVFDINGMNFTKTITSAIPGADVSFNNCQPPAVCIVPKDICLLYGANLTGGQTINHPITNNCSGQALTVKKGERVYFRVHAVSNGNPAVNWNPKITYTAGVAASTLDQNGLKPYESSFNEGFILSGYKPAAFPGNVGTATISWDPLVVNNPSDNVTYEVYHRKTVGQDNSDNDTVTGDTTPIFTFTCNANQNSSVVPTAVLTGIPVSITGTGTNLIMDDFYFKVTSTSNVNWKQYEWKPRIECTVQTDITGESGTSEGTFTSNETVYPIVDYSIYKYYGCSPAYSLFNASQVNNGVGLSIKPNLAGVFTTGDNGMINFVVKSNGNLIGKRIVTINNGAVSFNDNTAIPLAGGTIEIAYYVDDNKLYDTQESLLAKLAFVTNSTVKIFYNGTSNSFNVPNANVTLYQRPNPKFGPMLRQWGQFMYNPAAATGAVSSPYGNLIKESTLWYDLTLANNINTAVGNLNQNSINENNIDSVEANLAALFNSPFLVATPTKFSKNNAVYERWIGLHDENYASELASRAATMEQSFDSSYDVEPYEYQNMLQTGAYSINKISNGKNKNFSGGVSVDIGVSVGANASKTLSGDNKAVTDYIDFNGDRYPDIVTSNQVQYTKRVGGLFTPRGRSGDVNISESSSWGVGAQGSYSKGGDDGGSPKGYPKLHVSFEGFKGNAGGGLSINFSKGKSVSNRIWADINGDGLADLLEKNSSGQVSVGLNYGYSMDSGSYSWNLNNLFDSKSTNISGGGGVNKWNGSLEAGVAVTSAWNDSTTKLVDMNGDGLLDYVSSNDNITVRINRGNKFFDFDQQWSDRNFKRESVSVGFNANVTATAALVWYIPFTTICLKIPAASFSKSLWSTTTNKTKKTVVDFDGDGYADIVEQITNNSVRVYSSRIRRTDMLKTVYNPLGGKFTIDYKVEKVGYNNPHAKWAMCDLKVEDGYDNTNDGQDTYYKHFIYEDGKYDRREREFYGYKTIRVQDYAMDDQGAPMPAFRTTVSEFNNTSYFLNGLLKQTYIIKGDDENAKFSGTENIYEVRELNADNSEITATVLPDSFDVGGKEGRRTAGVVLAKTLSYLYELSPSPMLTSQVDFGYDGKGRVESYHNLGNINDPSDDYSAKIGYYSLANNILSVPSGIEVYDNSGTLRRRTTDVDASTGNIEAIHSYIDSGTDAVTHLKYDIYGNIEYVEHPANDNGQSMFYAYKYDEVYHKYVVQIDDAYGYTSSASYNSDFDKLVETKDMAGNLMKYDYDSFGRNTIVLAPKEIEAGRKYTIKFQYFPLYGNVTDSPLKECVDKKYFMPFSITSHFDIQHKEPVNDIQTVTFIDGLGRTIQVKKDIELNLGSPHHPEYKESMSISGKSTYDDYGRVVKQFHPYYEDKDCKINYIPNEYLSPYNSATKYDEMDRAVVAIDPADGSSTMQYSIDQDVDGTLAIKTKSTIDQNGSQSVVNETYKDVSGKVISSMNISPNGDLWTRFNYNSIGEMMAYTDPEGITTKFEYDWLGRKIGLHHADNGSTTFVYDKSGNIVKLQTANLAANTNLDPDDRFVKYYYDYNRVKHIIFPNNPDGSANISNVRYAYGSSGNETGRMIYQEDATGTQQFKYGNMGETIYNKRIVVGPNIPTRMFETRFVYDSWKRLQMMQYPDGEKVTYDYNLGGNLIKMTGSIYEGSYNYVQRIDYDYYEEKTYQLYGNKTETYYNYSPELRRLENLNVKTSDGNDLYDNYYKFDKVGNILQVLNSASVTANHMAGEYRQEFGYDELNRLVGARGGFRGSEIQHEYGNDVNSEYSLEMKYNNTSGIELKGQRHYRDGSIYTPNTYEHSYKYYSGTHKLKSVSDSATGLGESYSYDHDGNLIKKSTPSGSSEYLWDEVNRLRIVAQNHDMQHYIYDAAGERVLKANTDNVSVYENGAMTDPASVYVNGYTTYPSGFLVVDPQGLYTKHYYAGTQRIVSRMGDNSAGIFVIEGRGGDMPDFDDKKLQKAQINDLKKLAEIAKVGKITFKEFKPRTYEEIQKSITDELLEDGTVKSNATARPNNTVAASLPPIYYYHPDHLGSSTALTDENGNAYQFFLNLPFGETMAEQLPINYYKSPYKFNGKELDEETSLYYFGARYYDPRISVWYGVDPMAGKNPDENPYIYCGQNPVAFIDPDGQDRIYNANGRLIKDTGSGSRILVRIGNKDYAPSKLDYNKRGTRFAMARIVAKEAGAMGYKGYFGVKKMGEENKETIAYTSTNKERTVFMNIEHLKKGSADNFQDLRSTLFHEADPKKGHRSEAVGNYTYTQHATVYLEQTKAADFYKTSQDNQDNAIAGFMMRAIKAQGQGEWNLDGLVANFNKAHEGHYQIDVRFRGENYATFTVTNVKNNTTQTYSEEEVYEYIKDKKPED